jgi:cobalt-zinc-cadmium efflux system outer membrane protein
VAVAVLSFSMPAAGQTVISEAAGQTVISEADALARLYIDSPRVRAIRASAELARADVLTAGRWPNPRASYNRESVSGVTENMVTVTQALPLSGRRGLEVSAASALAEARSKRADEEIRRVRADLRSAYADLVSAQVRESALSRSLERLRALADLLAKRESAGDAAGYDRLRADREVMDVEGEWSQARADRARAQAALAAFFADRGDPMTLVAVVPDISKRPALPALDELLNRAAAVRGEPAALRQEIESARFAERAASRRLIPDPEIVAGTKSSNFAGGDVGSVFSVHATVPLFDHAQPEHAMAEARLAQAEASAAAFQTALRAQITAWRAVALERREAADRYRATATQGSDVLERIARVSYDAGERGILELLDAYRSGASARVRSAALDAAVRQAEIELEFVSGWEIQ